MPTDNQETSFCQTTWPLCLILVSSIVPGLIILISLWKQYKLNKVLVVLLITILVEVALLLLWIFLVEKDINAEIDKDLST